MLVLRLRKDGRWPFVVDPSGRTSTFIKYTGAAVPRRSGVLSVIEQEAGLGFEVYTIVELQDMESMRLRRAFLSLH